MGTVVTRPSSLRELCVFMCGEYWSTFSSWRAVIRGDSGAVVLCPHIDG